MDAFVVRMTIVPALMWMLGRRAWWLPRWLDRILPNVDVEGTSLDKKIKPGRNFSEAGMAEIVELHERLIANLRLGMSVKI